MLAASAGFSIAFSPVKWYDGEAGRIALILIHDSFEQSLIAVFGMEASMKNQLCKLIFHTAICAEASQIAWCAGANWRFAPHSSR